LRPSRHNVTEKKVSSLTVDLSSEDISESDFSDARFRTNKNGISYGKAFSIKFTSRN